MQILFVRRRKLGLGSTRGMSQYLTEELGVPTQQMLHERLPRNSNLSPQLVIRWGCTAQVSLEGGSHFLNRVRAIKKVNHKKNFRMQCQNLEVGFQPTAQNVAAQTALLSEHSLQAGGLNHQGHTESSTIGIVPKTWVRETYHQMVTSDFPVVVRPSHHAQGRNLWVANTMSELHFILRLNSGVLGTEWYASKLINKSAEYRVYFMSGKVVSIAEKTPANPDAVAWNVAQGGRFDVLRWDDWNPILNSVVRVGYEAFKLSELDFGGVDVMVDQNGRAYVIEINSAPSLPSLGDGSISYRQKCMAKGFKYIFDNGKDFLPIEQYTNWRDVIHPALWVPRNER